MYEIERQGIHLESPNIDEVSSRNCKSLCGGTYNTCVLASLAEAVNLSLLDPACLGRNPTAAAFTIY